MAVYSVEGKLGTGKTKFCVWMAQQALQNHRRIASNVDLRTHLLWPYRRTSYVRIPDKPTAFDLEAIGHGNPDSYDEDKNGILILDELGTWLNSRSYQDKGRADLLDWLIHARKLGWDVFLIVQDSGMIDKQVREAIIEYQVRCLRLDKVKIPFVGRFLGLIHDRWAYLPRMHLATARVGYGTGQIVAERWTYRGNDLHDAYDTRQVFDSKYPHGAYSVLPPWDFVPKLTPIAALKERIRSALRPSPGHRTSPGHRPASRPRPRALHLIASLPDPDQRTFLARRYLASLDQWASRHAQAGRMPT